MEPEPPLAPLASVAIFARAPRPGEAKTRLAPALGGGEAGAARAASLYAAFLEDTLAKVTADPRLRARLWVTGPEGDPSLERLSFRHNVKIARQIDKDLGARMLAALRSELEEVGGGVRGGAGEQPALLIGSDLPSLPVRHLRIAAETLARHDLVLGPASDGGFYLIGSLRPPPADLFEGVPWSSPETFAATLRRAKALSLSVGLAPPWYDVDGHRGLSLLRAHLALRPSAAPLTAARLSHLEIS